MFKPRRHTTTGFSLVELAVVVVVLALLVGVVMPTLQTQRHRAADRVTQTNLVSASKQARDFYLKNQVFTTAEEVKAHSDDWVAGVDLEVPTPHIVCLWATSTSGTTFWLVVVEASDYPTIGLWWGSNPTQNWCTATDVDQTIYTHIDRDEDGVADHSEETDDLLTPTAPGTPDSGEPSTPDTPVALPDISYPTEPVDPDDITDPNWSPPDEDILTIKEHDPDLGDDLDTPDPNFSPVPEGLTGLTSFISTDPAFPHRLLITSAQQGTITLVRQEEFSTTVIPWASGLDSPNAIIHGPDPSVPAGNGQLVLYPIYVGVASDGGSVVRIDPVTRVKTTVVSNLSNLDVAPTGLAGYACYNPGDTRPFTGHCLYASVGNTIYRINVDTKQKSVFATVSGVGNIEGLVATSVGEQPALVISGDAGTGLLTVLAARGDTPVTLSNPPHPSAFGAAYVGINSAQANQGVWLATADGLTRVQPSGATVGVENAVDVHYHGRADWLYQITEDALYAVPLDGGDPVLLWAPAAPEINFSALTISAGVNHSCGLTTDGAAYCWGYGGSGRLGNGSTANATTPTLVSGGHTWTSITAGDSHTCGLTTDGAAYCWGLGSLGLLGNGSTANATTPTLVSGVHTWASITAGDSHTCGLTTDGAAYCWGYGFYGQLGNGFTDAQVTTPTLVSGDHTWASIAAGRDHTCGLTTDGAAYCWGLGGSGQLGNGSTANVTTPTLVSGGHTWTSIAAGNFHTCGLTTDGAAYCWGVGSSGQLGNGFIGNYSTPQPVSDGHTWATISAGSNYSCGITTDGDAYCWGSGGSGRLGNGSTANATTPTLVSGGHTWASIAAGSSHTCGVTTAGSAYCWGSGTSGRLGNGSTSGNYPTPRLVSGGHTWYTD